MSTQHKRAPLPPLVYHVPDCPICNKEVSSDGDAFWCESCGGTWSSDSYDQEGEANPDVEQCSAEVMPYEDSVVLAGYRYRCVRDAGHRSDFLDYHIGTRSDGGSDYDGYPFEWKDGDYPQWTPNGQAVTDRGVTS